VNEARIIFPDQIPIAYGWIGQAVKYEIKHDQKEDETGKNEIQVFFALNHSVPGHLELHACQNRNFFKHSKYPY
jgi:hypothetical protein